MIGEKKIAISKWLVDMMHSNGVFSETVTHEYTNFVTFIDPKLTHQWYKYHCYLKNQD